MNSRPKLNHESYKAIRAAVHERSGGKCEGCKRRVNRDVMQRGRDFFLLRVGFDSPIEANNFRGYCLDCVLSQHAGVSA